MFQLQKFVTNSTKLQKYEMADQMPIPFFFLVKIVLRRLASLKMQLALKRSL